MYDLDDLDAADGNNGLTVERIATANTALASIAGSMESIWRLIARAIAGDDRARIDHELSTLQSQIAQAAKAARFDDGAWLRASEDVSVRPVAEPLLLGYGPHHRFDDDDDLEPVVPAPTPRDMLRSPKRGGIDTLYSIANLSGESDILSFRTNGASEADLRSMAQSVSDALSGLATARTLLGYLGGAVDESENHHFVFDAAIIALVDADLDEDATRLVARELQEELHARSLSIANDNAAIISRLFG